MGFAQAASQVLPIVGVNRLAQTTTLATPDLKLAVSPNVDTLYAFGVYDLAVDNVEVNVPKVSEGRFFAFSFYDP